MIVSEFLKQDSYFICHNNYTWFLKFFGNQSSEMYFPSSDEIIQLIDISVGSGTILSPVRNQAMT